MSGQRSNSLPQSHRKRTSGLLKPTQVFKLNCSPAFALSVASLPATRPSRLTSSPCAVPKVLPFPPGHEPGFCFAHVSRANNSVEGNGCDYVAGDESPRAFITHRSRVLLRRRDGRVDALGRGPRDRFVMKGAAESNSIQPSLATQYVSLPTSKLQMILVIIRKSRILHKPC